jgi:hypothetical protein
MAATAAPSLLSLLGAGRLTASRLDEFETGGCASRGRQCREPAARARPRRTTRAPLRRPRAEVLAWLTRQCVQSKRLESFLWLLVCLHCVYVTIADGFVRCVMSVRWGGRRWCSLH